MVAQDIALFCCVCVPLCISFCDHKCVLLLVVHVSQVFSRATPECLGFDICPIFSGCWGNLNATSWVQSELKLRDKHCWTAGEKQMSRWVIMMTDHQAVKSLRSPINALCQKWAACVPRGCLQKKRLKVSPTDSFLLFRKQTSGLIDSSESEMRKKTAKFVFFFCRAWSHSH